jgi:hypothetical protein
MEIDNCRDCPFCNSDSEYGHSCNIADIGDYGMPTYKDNWIPKECPLLNGSITIKLSNIFKPKTD